VTIKHAESAQGKTDGPNRVKGVGGSSDPVPRPSGQLEKDDIIILFLSVILIIATVWLATRIL
jgi:hypothetical protein